MIIQSEEQREKNEGKQKTEQSLRVQYNNVSIPYMHNGSPRGRRERNAKKEHLKKIMPQTTKHDEK